MKLRGLAVAMLALLLLVGLGPFCASASAATVARTMMNCADKAPATGKKPVLSACATPCVAVRGEALVHTEPRPLPPIAPWFSSPFGLLGLPVSPAIPPPRNV